MAQQIDDFFIKDISELENELNHFASVHNELEINQEEILSLDIETCFSHQQVSFIILNGDKVDFIYLLRNCANKIEQLDSVTTSIFTVDEMDIILFDDTDYFVLFMATKEKEEFVNLYESVID